MHRRGASPHCEVSAKRSGNWHALGNASFEPTVVTTYYTFSQWRQCWGPMFPLRLSQVVSPQKQILCPHNSLTTSVPLRIILSVILQLHAGVGIYLSGNVPGGSAGVVSKVINSSGLRNQLGNTNLREGIFLLCNKKESSISLLLWYRFEGTPADTLSKPHWRYWHGLFLPAEAPHHCDFSIPTSHPPLDFSWNVPTRMYWVFQGQISKVAEGYEDEYKPSQSLNNWALG